MDWSTLIIGASLFTFIFFHEKFVATIEREFFANETIEVLRGGWSIFAPLFEVEQ